MSILPRDDFVTSVLYIVVSQSTFQSFLIGRATLIDFTIKASKSFPYTYHPLYYNIPNSSGFSHEQCDIHWTGNEEKKKFEDEALKSGRKLSCFDCSLYRPSGQSGWISFGALLAHHSSNKWNQNEKIKTPNSQTLSILVSAFVLFLTRVRARFCQCWLHSARRLSSSIF